MKKKLHHGTKDLRVKNFSTLGAGIYFSRRKDNLYTSNPFKQDKGVFTMNITNNEQLNFDEAFKFAKLVLETAGLTGKKLAIGLDKIFKHYTGISALECAGINLEAEEEEDFECKTVSDCTIIGDEYCNAEDVAIDVLSLSTSDPEGLINDILEKNGYLHKVGNKLLPTKLGSKHSIIFDTGKRLFDGTPIREILWNTETIDFDKLFNAY